MILKNSKGSLPHLVLDDMDAATTTTTFPTPPNSAIGSPLSLALELDLNFENTIQVAIPDRTLSPKFSPSSDISASTSSTSTRSNSPYPVVPVLPIPPSPHPWTWRCHYCRINYRLSCTRRCLECSHEFCTSTTSGNASDRRRRRRSGNTRTCASEFDYNGWSAWGAYRRLNKAISASTSISAYAHASSPPKLGNETDIQIQTYAVWQPINPINHPSVSVSVSDTETTTDDNDYWNNLNNNDEMFSTGWRKVAPRTVDIIAEKKEKLFVEQRHDCWVHCDSPSECRHALYAACMSGRAKVVEGGGGAGGRMGRYRVVPVRERRGRSAMAI